MTSVFVPAEQVRREAATQPEAPAKMPRWQFVTEVVIAVVTFMACGLAAVVLL
jgi:hypothetical protein